MSRLGLMLGLPLSGKSTYAKHLQREEGWVVLCPDEIRLALHGHEFWPDAEDFVWANCKLTARYLLETDHNVLIDATNLHSGARIPWLKMADKLSAHLSIFVCSTSAEICKRRAIKDGKAHMIAVIERMASSSEPLPKELVDKATLVC